MKTAKPQEREKTHSMHAGIVRAMPESKRNPWFERPKDPVMTTPVHVTAEERHRIIELALHYQAGRRCVTPESDLRDWLDAEAEVVRTRVH